MKANELRIGNLIGCDISTLVVKAINDETVICHTMSGKPYVLHLEDVYGLKLTEEWLVKFGFEKLTDSKDGFKSSSYTYTKGISFIVHFDGVRLSTNFWIGNEKHYVHQLQNLYYALTGQELTINEN